MDSLTLEQKDSVQALQKLFMETMEKILDYNKSIILVEYHLVYHAKMHFHV